jgi:hypothetical protein
VQRELGDKGGMAWSLHCLGRIAGQRGDWQRAVSRFRESMALRQELGDRRGIVDGLEGLAAAAGAPGRGREEQAARLFGAADALRHAIRAPLPPVQQAERNEQLAALRNSLGEAGFRAAWEAGQALTWEQLVESL